MVIDQTHKTRETSSLAKASGISPDDLRHLSQGRFDGLNCAVIVRKLEDHAFGHSGDGGDSKTGGKGISTRSFNTLHDRDYTRNTGFCS